MVKTKICGLTSIAELHLAERAGAHAVGVLVGQVHVAGDFVSVETARSICSAASPFTSTVLVTHLKDAEVVQELVLEVGCSTVQLHSDLDPAEVQELRARLWPRRIIGKVSVDDESAVKRAKLLEGCADAIVLDSIDRTRGMVGGTGTTHDWSISARIARASGTPIVLAGGLTPMNVGAAIDAVRPWAVDVNSGVEDSNGSKSERLIVDFVRAASALGSS